MDDAAVRSVLGRFSYGVYALTLAHEGSEHGMTANWVMQTSFEPPMLAVAIANTSRTIELVREARHFVVNLLAQGQRDVAERLGRSSENAAQKLKGVKTKPAPASAAPVLADAAGWLECRLVATLPAGDHTLVLGQVVNAGIEHADARPLTIQETGLSYSA